MTPRAQDSKEALSLAYTGGPALPGDPEGHQQELRADLPVEHRGGGHRRSAVLGLGDIGPEAGMPVMERANASCSRPSAAWTPFPCASAATTSWTRS